MHSQKTDIQTPGDVSILVERFYERVYADDVLRPIFTDIAKISLQDHLPKMNSFWNAVLFGTPGYRGNPMEVHHHLDAMKPLNECHFIRWLSLFCLTVDESFSGPRAERAKEAAQRISANIAHTLQLQRNQSKERVETR